MNRIIVFLCLLGIALALTATQASNKCHCDITPLYCDFACCCDLDCSSVISEQCFLSLSSLFCLNSSYYFKIDSTLKPNDNKTGCYYYNISNALQQQVAISNKQINNIVASHQILPPLPSSSTTMDRGYVLGDVLTFSSISSFNFVSAAGECVSSTGDVFSSINYRMNFDMSCTQVSGTPNMFSKILGKNVPSYKQSGVNIAVPTLSGSFNEVIIYFFVARYGSANSQYIQNIKAVGKSLNNNIRTLRVRFVDPQIDIEQQDTQPSFFPQIPYDIFYPIYQIAYKY